MAEDKKARKPFKAIAIIAGILVVLQLVFLGVKFVLPIVKEGEIINSNDAQNVSDTITEDTVEPTPVPAATPEPVPTSSPEEIDAAAKEERMQQVLARTQELCTRTQPEITDPATWAEAGKELMEKLEQDYAGWNFTADVAAYSETAEEGAGINRSSIYSQVSARQDVWSVDFPESYPYLIAVNRAASTVTIYVPDEEGRYTVPYMAMACSGGDGTPTGFWFTPVKYQWRTLVGPCYGQYATRIWDSYLFHSVPYYTQHMDDVEYEQFNKLGSYASLGCIRLAVVDVKWIFDNCPIGTPVIIYDDAENPGPMGKPGTILTDTTDLALRGWDPTDPNPSNPWDEKYRLGTAIRSEKAWADYDAAMESGEWEKTLNATVTQGHSTDASIAGNPG